MDGVINSEIGGVDYSGRAQDLCASTNQDQKQLRGKGVNAETLMPPGLNANPKILLDQKKKKDRGEQKKSRQSSQ